MFTDYLVSTYRNLLSNNTRKMIRLGVVTLSIAGAVSVYAFIKNSAEVNNADTKTGRIYRVELTGKINTNTNYSVAQGLRNDFPHLESVTQVYVNNNAILVIPGENGHRKIHEDDLVTYADKYFLKTFDLKILAGYNNLLTQPDEVILTRKMADKFFGKTISGDYSSSIGRQIIVNDNSFLVSAILEDMADKSMVACHIILPLKAYLQQNTATVKTASPFSKNYIFITLPKNYSASQFEAALTNVKIAGSDKKSANKYSRHIHPLAAIQAGGTLPGKSLAAILVVIVILTIPGIIILIRASLKFIILIKKPVEKRQAFQFAGMNPVW